MKIDMFGGVDISLDNSNELRIQRHPFVKLVGTAVEKSAKQEKANIYNRNAANANHIHCIRNKDI